MKRPEINSSQDNKKLSYFCVRSLNTKLVDVSVPATILGADAECFFHSTGVSDFAYEKSDQGEG